MRTFQSPVGIWLDFRDAYIVFINGDAEVAIKVQSGIDESHPVGGSGTSTPYGPQDAISEHRYLNRRQQQEKQYFHTIFEKIRDRDAIYILGPAEAKKGLDQFLKKKPSMKEKVRAVESCDRLTDNQVRARIRSYFQSTEAT